MGNRQKWLLVIAGGAAFGVSLLAHLPAQLVLPKSAGKFQFSGIGGSIWRGRVEQVSFYGQPLPVQELNWSVSPAALLLGKLKADFHEKQAPNNRGSADWNLFSRQLELHALHWQLPAESFDPWTAWSGVRSQGQFILDLQSLTLPPGESFPSQLTGRLEWPNAVLQANSEYWPIGSPAMQLSDEGDAIRGIVTNTQPTLPGNGSVQCTQRNCRVTLSVQPTLDAPQSVLNALRLMGFQQSGNTFSGEISVPLE